MYRYDDIDQQLVDERVRQYAGQLERHLAGSLSEDDFRPLRLQNGLYIQRHAPMLRVAIPYGLLSSTQLRKLAHIARTYDRGYGHFTTRQNIQFNWPRLEDTAQILAELAQVQMHAIQTSGNCIRNITTDHLAGVAQDEVVDPLLWCEIVRQWSTFHPEFAYLPRKFKIAIHGALNDRSAMLVHDIGLAAVTDGDGEIGFRVAVGGGLGRTPIIGQVIREFLPWRHLLTYLEAILRVYNRFGRRDNKYKARIKILLKEMGLDAFRAAVDAEWSHLVNGPATLVEAEVARIAERFARPVYAESAGAAYAVEPAEQIAFESWLKRNVHAHKVPGYRAVTLSLKHHGQAPGDLRHEQMDAVATLADQFSQGFLRVTHEQNLLLADVREGDLPSLWRTVRALGLARPNIGLLTNIIACPGGDFCSLANARSIPVAEAIQARFDDLDYLFDIGELDLNISGCINACGHHHVGHIGILGVDKQGEEFYQITIGGTQGTQAAIGTIIGPSIGREEVPEAIARLIECYIERREHADERFIDTLRRVGHQPFKERVYATPRSPATERNGDRDGRLQAAA
jgi:sulfite reductase (NADPH) hemoprotein beta-component